MFVFKFTQTRCLFVFYARYFAAYASYFSLKSALSFFMARSDSWRLRLLSITSIIQPAMVEQWSEVRSRFVRMSDQTKPVSILHDPCWRRRMWFVRILSLSSSMICSRGSIFAAAVLSPEINAESARSRISSDAPLRFFSYFCASSEKTIPLFFISSAESTMFAAWSEILSRSPITLSSIAALALSRALI